MLHWVRQQFHKPDKTLALVATRLERRHRGAELTEVEVRYAAKRTATVLGPGRHRADRIVLAHTHHVYVEW